MAERRKQSVNGMTTGVIWQQILFFFLPILVGSLLQQLYNTADAMVVGRFVGTAALSAVGGTTNTIINLIIGFFVGLSSGATVIISQYFGGGDLGEVRRSVHTALALCLVGGVALMAVGLAATPWLLRALSTPEDVMSFAVPYLRIFFLGTIPNLMFNIGSGILRAVGDSKSPLYVLIFCTFCNILLDLVLVAALGLATAGAALATILSQLFSGILVLRLVHRKGGAFQIVPREIHLHRDLLGRILYIGLPAGLASVMYSAANVIIQKAINLLGTDAAAAWSIFWKLDGIYWPVSNAIGITVMTFTGQNYGAHQPERIRKIIRTGLGMHLGFSALFSLTLFLTRYLTVRCFTDDPAVIAEGVTIICMLAFFYPVFCCVEVFSSAMRGCGNSVMPTVLTLFGTCLLRLALLYTVTFPHLSNWTIAICYPATWGTTSLLFLIYYRFFRWMPGQKPQA